MTLTKIDLLYKALVVNKFAYTATELASLLDTTIRNVYDMIYRLRSEGTEIYIDDGYYHVGDFID